MLSGCELGRLSGRVWQYAVDYGVLVQNAAILDPGESQLLQRESGSAARDYSRGERSGRIKRTNSVR
jgi:hypothetical protein